MSNAATLSELLNPHDPILTAWNQALEPVCANVFPTFSDENKTSPYFETHIQGLKNNGQQSAWKGFKIYLGWTGTLVTRVTTMRGVNSDEHKKMLDQALRCAGEFWLAFGENLPLHLVQDFKLSNYLTTTENAETGFTDHTELHHDFVLGIRDGIDVSV